MTHRAFTPEAESIHTRLLSLDPVSTETCVNAATLIREQAETIERLRDLLKHADDVVIWESTPARPGFQEEIEEALGIGVDEQQENRRL